MGKPLLIHSMSEFSDIIFKIFDICKPKTVTEVGAEFGTFTKKILEYLEKNDGSLTSIDPAPHPDVEKLFAKNDRATLIKDKSLNVLKDIPAADIYLIDGDHNYYTVINELFQVRERTDKDGKPLVALMHDVDWPCARRDFYYNPDDIPEKDIHDHSFALGVLPGHPGLVQGGFRGEGQFAVAKKEGGPCNGVLTAVEDFLTSSPELDYIHVPAVFGLGIIYDKNQPWSESIKGISKDLHNNDLLSRLEDNRLNLFLKVLELQDFINDNINKTI